MATCVLLLVFSYVPFESGELIPAYYLASNSAYGALKAFVSELTEAGAFAKADFNVPARALALGSGLGRAGLNGLLYMGESGSRITFFTVFTDACMPQPEPICTPPLDCSNCGACVSACPSGAIDPVHGLDTSRCLRAHMSSALHPDWVLKSIPGYLGCELCQAACPANAKLRHATPSREAKEAFNMRELILGNTSAARTLVGRNITGSGKLTAEAIAFAKRLRDGRYDEHVKAALNSPFEAVRSAANWYFNS